MRHLKLVKKRRDKERSIQYYNIEDINHLDLRIIYELLKAEEARAKIVHGFYKGSKELQQLLEQHKKAIGAE